jgi:DNA-binding transcriptional MerR regulator
MINNLGPDKKSEIENPKFEIKRIHLHMPYKDREISKMYYTMGEVSAMFDVNQSLIRFYEKEFDVLQPKKNKKGNRYFTPEDLENFKIIFHLIRDKGYTLNGAKDHLKNNMGDTRENQRVIDSLENIKKFLLEVRDQL